MIVTDLEIDVVIMHLLTGGDNASRDKSASVVRRLKAERAALIEQLNTWKRRAEAARAVLYDGPDHAR